ncbi:MAG: hypothetical protein BroJett014_27640 [Planctomycetota bacterium]|nr:MAG: hypothetical protein BroJett014_27640 [Planctomycetota bacterium]
MEVRVSDGTGNTVTVEGNCAALASIGPANHFRVVAPPCVNGYEGGRVYDPVCEESRYLWAGYRYEWPIVGHRLLNTQQPDYNQPGPDGSQTTWKGNALGQYRCWNREYDVLMGRWTRPDPAKSPWTSLTAYHSRVLSRSLLKNREVAPSKLPMYPAWNLQTRSGARRLCTTCRTRFARPWRPSRSLSLFPEFDYSKVEQRR